MRPEITSLQNKVLKQIVGLQDNRTRKKSSEFGVEGLREISLAYENGFEVSKICLSEDLITEEERNFLDKKDLPKNLFWFFSKNCFEKLTMRKGASGLYLVFKKKAQTLLKKEENALYLILDGLEKPANLGAILRTADASGVTQVFLTNPKVDIYHPHVIRNSLGAVFSTPTVEADCKELVKEITAHNVTIYASYLHSSSKPYYNYDYKDKTAFVLGSEDQGITDFWKNSAVSKIIIPMEGSVNSLNVSVATSILLFEAVRQRQT